ncbi:hypothetical protein APHAL10511_003660 [Amanita phalloides]|nr:hypothetical protein APHAL10511_003660 [Amanita phalloides]
MSAEPNLTTTIPKSVLGKRKVQKEYVLRLTLSPEPTSHDSDHETSKLHSKPIVVNGVLLRKTKIRYKCTFAGCDKAYAKPSRLTEHERTHTGERPFTCNTCNKSYLRETHLQAHMRSHLPQSARPLTCSEPNCGKRFWTSQHLRVHLEWHNGAKAFACTEDDCREAFAKQHQLRAHICTAHAPPGTKPYRCDHSGCAKSFATNQHLRAHKKTHDGNRYTCVHSSCLAAPNEEPKYFSTWTALQQHMRTAHPPSCTHPSCNGRLFSSQKNLREHQKIHAMRDLEEQLNPAVTSGDVHADEPPQKKRRGGELGRDWKCAVDECEKDFKSKKSLVTHINVSHLGKKDFACPNCDIRYGYKRLLQRHLTRQHGRASDDPTDEMESSADEEPVQGKMDIDTITGKVYAERASANPRKALQCPYPDLRGITSGVAIELREASDHCNYVFTRAYDLRRHLRAVHGIEIEKVEVDRWAKGRGGAPASLA